MKITSQRKGERARLGRGEPRPRGSQGRLKSTRGLVTRAPFVRRETRRTAAAAAALPESGFTIIEIMTAMMIFGMIVAAIFATWSAVAHGAVAGNKAAATAQRSRIALRTMEDALGSTRSYVADVEYYTFDAENGSEPYLSFVTKLSPSFPRSGRFGEFDVRRVTFSLESGGDYTSKKLVLRQAPVLMDMDEDEQNYPVVLANGVKKFEMEFWDKQKGDWLDEWTQTNQLPQMVKFTLQLADEPNEITRIVALPSVAVQSMWQIPGSTLGGPGFRSNNGGGFGSGNRIGGFNGGGGGFGGGNGFRGGGGNIQTPGQ